MSQQSAEILERLLRDSDLGWSIGPAQHKDQVLQGFNEQLNQLTAEYHKRFPDQDAVSFSPEALEAEASKNPHKVKAFLQAFVSPCTAEMLIITWRILQGLRIRAITMEYKEKEKFTLAVVLARAGDEKINNLMPEEYLRSSFPGSRDRQEILWKNIIRTTSLMQFCYDISEFAK